jgi:hypothetical protein
MSVMVDGWNNDKVTKFTHNLSKAIVKNNFRIISGFGLGIGSTIINGALEEITTNKYKHINEHLLLRPFPQLVSGLDSSIKEHWTNYRIEMIKNCGIAIFIFGNKVVNNEVVIADGMLEEFQIAKDRGKIIIPVGSTGGAAKNIYDEIKENIDNYPYLNDYLEDLGIESDPDKLIKLITTIVCELRIK